MTNLGILYKNKINQLDVKIMTGSKGVQARLTNRAQKHIS